MNVYSVKSVVREFVESPFLTEFASKGNNKYNTQHIEKQHVPHIVQHAAAIVQHSV